MKIQVSLSDPDSLVKLRDMDLVEAMGFAMLDIQGSTRVDLASEALKDDKEVVRRCVELLTFLIEIQRGDSSFLEFVMEPTATCVAREGKFELYDFFDNDRLLDVFDDATIEENISYVDEFFRSAFEQNSPQLLDHLINRRFLLLK